MDIDEERRRDAEMRFGVPAFSNFEEMLTTTAADVVLVLTPPHCHAHYCLQSLRHNAHVICEKPFVMSVAEADEVISLAREVNRQVALNHMFREMPIFRAVKQELGKPDVGSLVVAQVWQLMNLPGWDEEGWRRDMPDHVFFEAGIHLLDYTMLLFDEQPVSVTATSSSCGARDIESDSVVAATLEFSNGRIAQIWQNRLCHGPTQFFEVRADCEHASLRASYGGRARLSAGLYRTTRPHVRFEYGVTGLAWREVENRRVSLAKNPKDPGVFAAHQVLAQTLRAFEAHSEPPVSAASARDGLEVLAALYHSAKTGRRIRISDLPRTDLPGIDKSILSTT